MHCYSGLDNKYIVTTHWKTYGKKLANKGVAKVQLEDFITLAYFFERYLWGIFY